MRFLNQTIVRTAAILALAAASTTAFAQTAEYRRGYDDGYAAAQRAGDDRGRGQGRNAIRIESAEYGARGAMCDARQSVRRDMERTGGTIIAGNQLCGDPAPRVEKRLSVVYRCGGDEAMRVVAREGETLRLNCRR